MVQQFSEEHGALMVRMARCENDLADLRLKYEQIHHSRWSFLEKLIWALVGAIATLAGYLMLKGGK